MERFGRQCQIVLFFCCISTELVRSAEPCVGLIHYISIHSLHTFDLDTMKILHFVCIIRMVEYRLLQNEMGEDVHGCSFDITIIWWGWAFSFRDETDGFFSGGFGGWKPAAYS